MPNQQKTVVVETVADKFKRAKGVYFTAYLGLNVADITELRRQFHEGGVEFVVVKNTLAKISAEKTGFKELEGVFKGPTAIAFSYDDPIAPARVLRNFKQSHDLPELKAFLFEGEIMEKESFSKIAKLPSREELLAGFVGRLSSPMSRLAYVLKGPLTSLDQVLNRLKEAKQS